MSRLPAPRSKLAVGVASALGVGFSPLAPGTAGSLLALLPAATLLGHPVWLAVAGLLASAAGLWAVPRASGGADAGWVVIDEVAGQWITLLGAPVWAAESPTARLVWLAAGFALFRLLDITKPGPIGRLDRRHDALGVMGDDILAGLFGAALLWCAGLLLHGMGVA